jgi:hypothetical protein
MVMKRILKVMMKRRILKVMMKRRILKVMKRILKVVAAVSRVMIILFLLGDHH